MKKMLLAVSVCCIQYAQAQTTVDFEDLIVPGVDTAWLGSDQSGGFTSNGVFFPNTYTISQWGNYWSAGYVYSNSTNTTNGSYTLDYSAFAGGGANGSSNYAVNYGESSLVFTGDKKVLSIAITNTTYAALSMKNGDAFAKQFGSPTNAMGELDGTNGEDWFRLSIIGKDADGNSTGTVVFYLADYRFEADEDDYIVSTWETVDLTPLGTVSSLDFQLESSDNGDFGMNTPVYFALDNLVIDEPETATLPSLDLKQIEVYPNPTTGMLTVRSETGTLSVRAASGEIVYQQNVKGNEQVDLSQLANGIYFVELHSEKGLTTTRISKF